MTEYNGQIVDILRPLRPEDLTWAERYGITLTPRTGKVDAPPSMKLRCAKCRRVLAVGALDQHGLYLVWSGAAPMSTNGTTGYQLDMSRLDERPVPMIRTRRSVAIANASSGVPDYQPSSQYRDTFVCHRRCGARYTITRLHMARAYSKACELGLRQMIAGIDV